MEIRLFTEAVLRPYSSPLPSLLTSSISAATLSRRPWPSSRYSTASFVRPTPSSILSPPSSRTFAISHALPQQATAVPDDAQPQPSSTPSSLSSSATFARDRYDPNEDPVSHQHGSQTPRFSSLASRRAKAPFKQAGPMGKSESTGDSSTDIMTAFLSRSQRPIRSSPRSLSASSPPPKPAPQASLRLTPSLGRSVAIAPSRGMDLGRGLGVLNSTLSMNNVRVDFRAQKFHERKGLKKKRLRKQRWRKLFMKGFKQMVGRVKDLRKKGW
ncbi:MAG: hypothetical protein M1817_006206 [Caeruleum heppii]|nr:MAG: hypothetical protein M1817_006206 [Caeruleum heppii]